MKGDCKWGFLKEGVRIGSTQRNRIEWAQGYRIRPFSSLPGQEIMIKPKRNNSARQNMFGFGPESKIFINIFIWKLMIFLHIWIFERFYLSTKIILFVALFMACNGMADGILGALNRLRRIENERKIENLVSVLLLMLVTSLMEGRFPLLVVLDPDWGPWL